ncbi:hypothetical protein DUI87_04104 [Hirundo rustica rustica]|uniref:Uncharacterized protein n=1 Tax=Hirundo rustica rustica TaxID=333673 RepID=A0A3M0L1Q6_HIRRU|nr:hypothetical protein DUI87_04104 [Hirundo rustica rustica]
MEAISNGEEKIRSSSSLLSLWVGSVLDFVLTSREGLVGNVKLKGSLGCSDYEMVESQDPEEMTMAHIKFPAVDFRRAGFGLFRELLSSVLWDVDLEGRVAQEFKRCLLQAQQP